MDDRAFSQAMSIIYALDILIGIHPLVLTRDCPFTLCTDCPKKNTIGIWVSIAKEPFMESKKSNQIMKPWLFFYNSLKTPSNLAK